METLRFRDMLGLLAIGAIAACGSRSQLLSPPAEGDGGTGGAGGTGGTTTTTTTTTTTSEGGGGTGGAPMGPCAELTFATPYSDLDGGIQSHQRSPKFAYSNQEKMRVTLATAWQATEGPGPNLPIELRHTSFDPWIDFPAGSGFGPTYLASLDAGVSFAIAQGQGDLFAMLFRDFQQPPPGGLRFSGGFKPKSGDVPMSILADPQADDALFLAFDGKSWAYGAGDPTGNGLHETRVGVVSDGFVAAEFPVACTTTAVFADAVSIDGAFLAAVGTSGGLEGCDFGIPTPAGGPFVVRFDGTQLVGLMTFGANPVVDVRMAPRAGGAWLVWYDPGNDALVPSLVVSAFTAGGEMLVLPTSIPTSCNAGTLAAASFEDFLMVACIQPEPEGASPHVQVFDPDGVARGAITVQATGLALGRAALIGSPISRSAVLAWSETAGVGDQIRLTRVDCVDGT